MYSGNFNECRFFTAENIINGKKIVLVIGKYQQNYEIRNNSESSKTYGSKLRYYRLQKDEGEYALKSS